MDLEWWDLEVVFDAVFDAHAHEGVEAEVNQWEFAWEVIHVVAHCFGDDGAHALFDGFGRWVPADCFDVQRQVGARVWLVAVIGVESVVAWTKCVFE